MQTLQETRRQVSDNLRFIGQAIRRPVSIGAVMPSSKSLAEAMAAEIDPDLPGRVIELGGGTGNITAALLDGQVLARDLIVLERQAELCQVIARRFPEITVLRGDATRLGRLLRKAGGLPVKAVVSGLPLLTMPRRVEAAIVTQAFSVMAADGIFVQFTYGPLSPITRSITNSLDIVGFRSNWVLDNMPPAAVWVYRRRSALPALKQAV